jgi:hypothetical protein
VFLAGYLYYDLCDRLISNGRLIEVTCVQFAFVSYVTLGQSFKSLNLAMLLCINFGKVVIQLALNIFQLDVKILNSLACAAVDTS